MTKFLAGVMVWIILCFGFFVIASGVGSFVRLEWQWAGGSALNRFVLSIVFVWLALVVGKAGVDK